MPRLAKGKWIEIRLEDVKAYYADHIAGAKMPQYATAVVESLQHFRVLLPNGKPEQVYAHTALYTILLIITQVALVRISNNLIRYDGRHFFSQVETELSRRGMGKWYFARCVRMGLGFEKSIKSSPVLSPHLKSALLKLDSIKRTVAGNPDLAAPPRPGALLTSQSLKQITEQLAREGADPALEDELHGHDEEGSREDDFHIDLTGDADEPRIETTVAKQEPNDEDPIMTSARPFRNGFCFDLIGRESMKQHILFYFGISEGEMRHPSRDLLSYVLEKFPDSQQATETFHDLIEDLAQLEIVAVQGNDIVLLISVPALKHIFEGEKKVIQ